MANPYSDEELAEITTLSKNPKSLFSTTNTVRFLATIRTRDEKIAGLEKEYAKLIDAFMRTNGKSIVVINGVTAERSKG